MSLLYVRDKDGNLAPVTTINGEDGLDGKTPYIHSGYWCIGDVNTGVKAVGVNGYTPQKGIDYFTDEELAGIEKKYELWNDITLTEDAASISLEKKDNGEYYAGFSKMKIAIFGKFTEGVTTRLRATLTEKSGNIYFLWGPSTTYTYADGVQGYAWHATVERISNNMFRSEAANKFINNQSADATASPSICVLYSRKKPADYYLDPSGFNLITAETPTNFLAGTNIKVWGVKE